MDYLSGVPAVSVMEISEINWLNRGRKINLFTIIYIIVVLSRSKRDCETHCVNSIEKECTITE